MATYTTLFVATDGELTEFFPGWRKPLSEPIVKNGKNPFTGEPIQVEVWDPGPPADRNRISSIMAAQGRPEVAPVVLPESDYQEFLETGVPDLLRTFPHVGMKNMSLLDMLPLAEVVGAAADPPARFIDLRPDEGSADAVSSSLVLFLAGLDKKGIEDTAHKLHTLCDEQGMWGDGDQWALTRLVALAQIAVERDGHLFSWFNF